MLEKTSKNLWKSMILRRRNLDLDMVFIDPTQCWHFKPKVLKMSQKVTQKHLKIKVRAHEKQLQKPYQKTAWNTTAFSWFLVPNGSPKRPQNLSFFCSGRPLGHTVALKWPRWHPGADFASKYLVLSGILHDFWMVFEWFLNDYSWSYDETK